MNVILKISLRNLFRQKRRNILLGSAMAFGTMILVLASSFSHGISDVLFNKIVVYVAGHVSVGFSENGNMYRQVFHDGDRMINIVKKELSDITQIQEALGIFGRAIGNGKSDNVIMVGVDLKQTINVKQSDEVKRKELEEYKQNFKMVEGNFLDINNPNFENPVAVSVEKAKYLNIKKGDILRIRFSDINGQSQAARLNVVAIFKPANSFMSMPIFLEVAELKKLAGYGPHDIGQLYLRIKDAKKFAVRDADKLHDAMQSMTAVIFGTMTFKAKNTQASVFGFKSDSVSHKLLIKSLPLINGDTGIAFGKDGAVIAQPLAAQLGVKPGDSCAITYTTKYDPHAVTIKYPVKAVFKPANGINNNVLLVNEKSFYNAFYGNWPQDAQTSSSAYFLKKSDPLYSAFDPEWLLLKRARSTDEARKQMRDMASTKFKGAVVDVESMYEMASDVLKLEGALNLITFGAVMILFFIILIGVINTLRMTIRERTREIGTVRAIGMQKKDVRNSFVLETMFLGLFSAIAGTALAFLAMLGLSRIIFKADDNPLNMLLVNSHLNFVPSIGATVFYIVLIVVISVVTAYFPARRAARMSAADALRHFE
jgi:ABC-type transport system, involved in lipoprotein release, permease component